MVCPLKSSSLQSEVSFILLITGILFFSSSALSFRDQFRSLTQTPRSQFERGHGDKTQALHVAADIFDSGVDSGVQTSEKFTRGDENNHDVKNSKHILTFHSSFTRQSKASVYLSPDINLDEFFLHTDHLLSAGKSVHSTIVSKTSELVEEWTIACDNVGACLPNNDHGVIMSVRTAGISVPGLSVEWSALIGTNLVHRNQNPELEFVLIKDETKASGAKPILWIYNKLTRNGSKSQKSKRKRGSNKMDTKLFTRLGFYKENSASAATHNEQKESYVIRCEGIMEMKYRIPSMLGKLIFSSNAEEQKQKAERNVSNLITRQIEKDTEKNVMRWEENFRAWTNKADDS